MLEIIITVLYGLILVVVGSFAVLVGVSAGICVGLVNAVVNYVKAVVTETHMVFPQLESDDEPARRSYLFGPGFVQLRNIFVTNFRFNTVSARRLCDRANTLKESDSMLKLTLGLGVSVYQGVLYALSIGMGIFISSVMSILLSAVIVVLVIITFAVVSVVWLIDRLYLLRKRIFSDCAMCHTRSTLTHYRCDCGRVHKKLVPGPYGIWFHRCECKRRLPATFLTGRSKLRSVCPVCGNPIIASDVRPLSFQLVGETFAGKTVFLSAFFHEYIQMLRSGNIRVEIPRAYEHFFQNLENWFAGAECPSTTDFNSRMYPILVDCGLNVRRQFSVYDIAGEAFAMPIDELPFEQEQFCYCNGILYLIDPLKSKKIYPENGNGGIVAAERVANNFINYIISVTTKSAASRIKTPLSVIISKADCELVQRAVGEQAVVNTFNSNREKYPTLEAARDAVCESFLEDIGFIAVIKSLRSTFEIIHYFPVSAIGHDANGTAYTPQGVLTPFEWMIAAADKKYAEASAFVRGEN